MRRVLVVSLALALVALAGVSAMRLAPVLDPRWQVAGDGHEMPVADRLTQARGTPLLFVPGSVSREPSSPVRLVVALPGLDAIGRELADHFVDAAEAHRWLVLAPSPVYDPIHGESLQAADLRVDDEILALVDRVIARSSSPVLPGLLVVGFSRGAQSAHRFALRHGAMVAVLASFSAGTYTMPTSTQPYPLGMGGFEQWDHGRGFDPAGLRGTHVLVGVGAIDDDPADVARAWDQVGGTTRVERGARFTVALRDLGVDVRFQLYPRTGHLFTPAMRDDAVALFSDAHASDALAPSSS